MRSTPTHAGSLKPCERLAFAVAFALMAAFAVVVTASAARQYSARQHSARQHSARPAGPAATSQSGRARGGTPGTSGSEHLTGGRNQQLANALVPVLLHGTGSLAVGVIDRTTGVRVVYNGRHRFDAASIVRADILAILLLQDQRAGTVLGAGELRLAAQMIETNDAGAANDLWRAAGGPAGVAQANVDLGLRHTTPGQGVHWALTSTTVSDQLRLLEDLTSSRSPLTAASRSYELSLLRKVLAGQAWAVPAVAAAGSSAAVRNGRRGDPRRWVVGRIDVIHHAGQVLLVAVLSDGQPTRLAGIAEDDAAAVTAVTLITARSF